MEKLICKSRKISDVSCWQQINEELFVKVLDKLDFYGRHASPLFQHKPLCKPWLCALYYRMRVAEVPVLVSL